MMQIICQHFSLSSFLLTKGADNAGISFYIGIAARVESTEVLQVCVGQLGRHLRHLPVWEAQISRV